MWHVGLMKSIICRSIQYSYCFTLGLIDQLQTVMRVAARLVLRKRKFDPISADIRDCLHWLPIRSRIDFELGLLVYKCLHGIAPAYLTEMLVLKSTVPALFPPSLDGERRSSCAKNKNKNDWTTKLRHFWDPSSGTNCLTIWGTLPCVHLFSNKDWNRICLNNVDVRYSLNWPPSVRSIASKEVTFTLHYIKFQILQ